MFLWDVLCAARIFGFSDIPEHDQVFQFELPASEACNFLTAEECCSLVDPGRVFSIDTASTSEIRVQMQRFVKILLTTSLSLDQDDTDELIMDNLRSDSCILPLDDNFNMGVDAWLAEQAVPWHAFSEAQIDEARNHFMLEFNKKLDNLGALHGDLENYELSDFGVCERRLQLPYSHRLSQSGLMAHLEELERPQPIKCMYTDSAVRFIRVLIEGIHFGSAVEVKVRKKGLIDDTWDFGVLFASNGTSWKCLILSDDDDLMIEDDGDGDYSLSDDDDHVD